MALKSILITGSLNDGDDGLSYTVWNPDSDIKNGQWIICLDSVTVKFQRDCRKLFSFCVKTNFIEQSYLNKQGRLDTLLSCFGIFSCKGEAMEEVTVRCSSQNWFLINNVSSVLKVSIQSPFTHQKPNVDAMFACYFLYKRIQ